MKFRILGPLDVTNDAGPVALAAPKQRALLGVLLLHPNETVSTERLVDELWGERPPATATKVLQTYVSQLRRVIGADTIATRPPGYVLQVDEGAVDASHFRRLTAEGRELAVRGDHDGASGRFREALALWRGPPLADVVFESFARNEAERLEEERLGALIDLIDSELALGRHDDVLPELELLTRQHPLRERLRMQLMLALYRSGRQADALAVYQDTRRTLVNELGIEPGRELQELERAVLSHDAALGLPPQSKASAPEPRKRTVLPLPPTPLVGRTRELPEILGLVRRHRLVTLTGPGGSGKTRLAVQAAAELAGLFQSGAYFVSLAPLSDPKLVFPTIGRMLGVEQPETVAEHLRDRNLLLVLDNFEHLLDAAVELSELLGETHQLHVLVTSRAVLRISAEHAYPVPPLARDEAVSLFTERAQSAEPSFVPDESVPLVCARLDDLPLAIELAAPQVKVLTPAAMLARLESRIPFLARGARDAPERQRTLRATLDWSYTLLALDAQRLLARLSVFAGGWTFEAAEAICDARLDCFASLIENNLVRHRESRLSMLETIREYAAQRLAQTGEAEDVRRRHALHFLTVAEELRRTEPPGWLKELDRDRDNLRAALSWMRQAQEAEMFLRLAVALGPYWQIRGYVPEGRRWTTEALQDSSGPRELLAKARYEAAALALRMGDYDDAESSFDAVLGTFRELDFTAGVAHCLFELAILAMVQGDYGRAQQLADEAARLAIELSDPVLTSRAGGVRARIALSQGDEERSDEFLATVGGPGRSWIRGFLALRRGDDNQALALFEETLRYAEEQDVPTLAVECLAAIGVALAAHGDAARATRLMAAASGLSEHGLVRMPATPFERDLERQTLRTLSDRLGERAFQDAWGEGGTMTLEQAVMHARETALAPQPGQGRSA